MNPTLKCPYCGSHELSTMENIIAWSPVNIDENGKAYYGSSESDVNWNSQRTITNERDECIIRCTECDNVFSQRLNWRDKE